MILSHLCNPILHCHQILNVCNHLAVVNIHCNIYAGSIFILIFSCDLFSHIHNPKLTLLCSTCCWESCLGGSCNSLQRFFRFRMQTKQQLLLSLWHWLDSEFGFPYFPSRCLEHHSGNKLQQWSVMQWSPKISEQMHLWTSLSRFVAVRTISCFNLTISNKINAHHRM